VKRRGDLTTPRERRRLDVSYDAEAFGRFGESIASFLGTARYLVWQTVVILVWLALNLLPPARYQFDPWGRGLVLLTLLLSLQASYAAPLILLAQARQERRDRINAEYDREVAARTQADTEFLAREIASVRLALADVVTGEELRDELERLTTVVERLADRLDTLDRAGSDRDDADRAGAGRDQEATASDPVG
jgi:uncharacterized membrane protein